MNRPRYPYIECDHPNETLPGYLLCDHLRRNKTLPHTVQLATEGEIGVALCAECEQIVARRQTDNTVAEPPLHLACAHFIAHHLGPNLEKVLEKVLPPRNDATFLGYVALHAETDRHLFSREQVYRLHVLAGAPMPAAAGMGEWFGMDSDYVRPLVMAAGKRLAATGEEAFFRVEARDRIFKLLRKFSIRTGHTFTLASGRTSDFFLDCKPVTLRADGHVAAGRILLAALEQSFPTVEAVAGVAVGGCPLASAVATLSFWPMRPADTWPHTYGLNALYVREKTKDHGIARRIEGQADDRAHVVLLEDVVTTGGSSLAAHAALVEANFQVLGVLALVDREEGATEAFAQAGIPFRTIFTQTELRA